MYRFRCEQHHHKPDHHHHHHYQSLPPPSPVIDILTTLSPQPPHTTTTNTTTQFTAGESLKGYRMVGWNNLRCGSVFTAKVEGRALYGIIKRFVRVVCRHFGTVTQLAVVEWFPEPQYPDGDPLLVLIDTTRPVAEAPEVLYLDEIDPARVLYEIDGSSMYMMRVEGLDHGCE